MCWTLPQQPEHVLPRENGAHSIQLEVTVVLGDARILFEDLFDRWHMTINGCAPQVPSIVVVNLKTSESDWSLPHRPFLSLYFDWSLRCIARKCVTSRYLVQ